MKPNLFLSVAFDAQYRFRVEHQLRHTGRECYAQTPWGWKGSSNGDGWAIWGWKSESPEGSLFVRVSAGVRPSKSRAEPGRRYGQK
jgi:hypothetical protein